MNTLWPSRRPLGGDRGSIPLALMVTVVGIGVSVVLATLVLSQLQTTRVDVRRAHALHAAQAGLDIAVGRIRAIIDGVGTGTRTKLPCGPITDRVGVGGTARYETAIAYYATNPQGRSPEWLADNKMACLAAGGTAQVPAYAVLTARGTDSPTGAFDSVPTRQLIGTYTFQTTNQNIAGGLIHVYKTATSIDLCLDAGSGDPPATVPPTKVTMQRCSADSVQQTFAYNQNLNLVLVSSTAEFGMCLEAATSHAVNVLIVLQPCARTVKPSQQWSLDDSASFVGTTNGADLDGFCFRVQSQNTVGSSVVLTNVCGGGYDNIQTFAPEAAVGAGAAGASSGQLVNFNQFGRCLDVTDQNVNETFLIAWPCKQAPDASKVTWNQKFALPVPPINTVGTVNAFGTGPITTTHPLLGLFCLRSPGSTADGQYVRTIICPPILSMPANMTWKVYGTTNLYPTSYRIVDNLGFCLTPRDPKLANPDFYQEVNRVSKVKVAVCDGSTLQKWNAPPNPTLAVPLKDISER